MFRRIAHLDLTDDVPDQVAERMTDLGFLRVIGPADTPSPRRDACF